LRKEFGPWPGGIGELRRVRSDQTDHIPGKSIRSTHAKGMAWSRFLPMIAAMVAHWVLMT
jgi:hypothetical protein